MKITKKALCVVYGLIAAIALIGTWGNNIRYLEFGFLGGNMRFWQDTLANPASRSMTIDVFFLSLAATVWMLLEARRLSMRGRWWYVIFALLIAVSFTFPIFLINRERALAERDRSASVAGQLQAGDVLGLVLLGIGFTLYAARSLTL